MNKRIQNLKNDLNKKNFKNYNSNIISTEPSIDNKSEILSSNLYYNTINSNNIDLNSFTPKNEPKKVHVDSNLLYYILSQLNQNNEINTIFYKEYSKFFQNINQKIDNIMEIKNQIIILNKYNEKIYQILTNKRNRGINESFENNKLNQTLELSLNEKKQSLENNEITLNDILDKTLSYSDFKDIPIEEKSFLQNQSFFKQEK